MFIVTAIFYLLHLITNWMITIKIPWQYRLCFTYSQSSHNIQHWKSKKCSFQEAPENKDFHENDDIRWQKLYETLWLSYPPTGRISTTCNQCTQQFIGTLCLYNVRQHNKNLIECREMLSIIIWVIIIFIFE